MPSRPLRWATTPAAVLSEWLGLAKGDVDALNEAGTVR